MGKAQALDDVDLVPKMPQALGRPSERLVAMQFRMDPEFVRAFKVHAAQHGLKLNELLLECFAALQRERRDANSNRAAG